MEMDPVIIFLVVLTLAASTMLAYLHEKRSEMNRRRQRMRDSPIARYFTCREIARLPVREGTPDD